MTHRNPHPPRLRPWAMSTAMLFYSFCSALSQDCSAVLGYVRDISSRDFSSHSVTSFRRLFCDQQYSSFRQAKDVGATLKVPIDDLPVSLSGHDRESQWSEYQRTMCEYVSNLAAFSVTDRKKVERVNEGVVRAWAECVASPGVKFWAEANETDMWLAHDVHSRYSLNRRYSYTCRRPGGRNIRVNSPVIPTLAFDAPLNAQTSA
jgi:hypothetical protein